MGMRVLLGTLALAFVCAASCKKDKKRARRSSEDEPAERAAGLSKAGTPAEAPQPSPGDNEEMPSGEEEPESEEEATELLAGTTHVCKRGKYGKFKVVLPADPRVRQRRFPNLVHAPCLFFAFASLADSTLDTLALESFAEGRLRTIGNDVIPELQYGRIRGFEATYATVRRLDRYSLPAKKGDVVKRLKALRDQYRKELDDYETVLFRVGPSKPFPIEEAAYDINRQKVTVDFGYRYTGSSTATKLIPDTIFSSSSAYDTVLAQFNAQGLGKFLRSRASHLRYWFDLPLDIAKDYFPKPGKTVAVSYLLSMEKTGKCRFGLRDVEFIFYLGGVEQFYIDFEIDTLSDSVHATATRATASLRKARRSGYAASVTAAPAKEEPKLEPAKR